MAFAKRIAAGYVLFCVPKENQKSTRYFRGAGGGGLRLPASASCLARHSHPAGRCPNSSSLFRPLAAVVAVAKQMGSIQKIQVALLEDFLCSAGFESLRDGHSRQQQMLFFVTTLSGENVNRKNPQIFSIYEIKILFPLFMPRATRRAF